MNKKTPFFRRKIFIKKKFQTNFAVQFLILIAVEALLAIGLFIYLSEGTMITGYSGTELIVAKTGEYFLPTLLLANLILIGGTAAIGFVMLLLASHKIAGPLYRFEKSLETIGGGDLTHRFNIRSDDELRELAERINEFSLRMEKAVTQVKGKAGRLDEVLAELYAATSSGKCDKERTEALIKEAVKNLGELTESISHFKTEGLGKA